MKFSLSWLRTHLHTEASVDIISDALTQLGLEVEEVSHPGLPLKDIRVGYILETHPHPNADRLRLCRVDIGQGEPVEVVCGAPNARPDIFVAFVSEGGWVPATQSCLKKSMIRGVESQGMLCSFSEMGLSGESHGIAELDPKLASDLALGSPVAAVLGLNDTLITIGITPNRSDCLSVRGIARELAAKGLGTLHPLQDVKIPAGKSSSIQISRQTTGETEGCLFFAGRLISGIKNGESPSWLKQRLESIGVRSVSLVVDVLNFILFDRGSPMHVFDADCLQGNVQVTMGREGESFSALNGKSYGLDDSMVVVRDDTGPVSLAGIMGGEASSATLETTNIFLESALFDRSFIARAGRKCNILSDSRYRFERGVDPQEVLPALEQATALILEYCGGTPSEVVFSGDLPSFSAPIQLTSRRVNSYSGRSISLSEMASALEALGFSVSAGPEPESLLVTPPSWRHDVTREEDLVEEIFRLTGYDQIPSCPLPMVSKKITVPSRGALTRRVLASRGLLEVMSWSFISRKEAELFQPDVSTLTLTNPLSLEMEVMRPNLLPNLMCMVRENMDRGQKHVSLFEVGSQFSSPEIKGQHLTATGVRSGHLGAAWNAKDSPQTLYDVKGDAFAILNGLGVHPQTISLRPVGGQAPWYHPGRSALIYKDGKTLIGAFGEIHPTYLKAFDFKTPLFAFELNVDGLPQVASRVPRKPLKMNSLQPVERDFAFLLKEAVPFEKVVAVIRKVDRRIEHVHIFDIYAGKGVEPGFKSIALRIKMQPQEVSFTDDDLKKMSDQIIEAVRTHCEGALRA